jgi:hypothetical protein
MSRAAVLVATGVVLVTSSALNRRSLRRVTEVPPMARRLGQRGSVDDWRAGNERAATVMIWAGAAMVVVGIVVGIVAGLR